LGWVEYTKKEIVCQEKNPQDMGYFLKPSGENLTGSFTGWVE
jgi:hypothetical protein